MVGRAGDIGEDLAGVEGLQDVAAEDGRGGADASAQREGDAVEEDSRVIGVADSCQVMCPRRTELDVALVIEQAVGLTALELDR